MLKYPEKLLYTSTLIVSLSYKDDDKLKEHDIIKNIKKKDDISNVTHLTGYIADSYAISQKMLSPPYASYTIFMR